MVRTSSGLEGIVAAETKIGHVDGENGRLIYRGRWARDLALHHSFEEAAYLLWYGEMPDTSNLKLFRERLIHYRKLTPELKQLLAAMPQGTPLMNVIMAVLSALSGPSGSSGSSDSSCSADSSGSLTHWPPTVEQAVHITAIVPVIIAYRYRQLRGLPYVEAADESGHPAYYLHALFGSPASEAVVRALNAYMILAMEHGLNASTFAARVVASTESDLYSAAAAAVGAMKGPLHGGAPSEVFTLLEEIGTKENAEPVLREMLARGEKIMGFGHRVYKTVDPRAEALREVTSSLAADDPWLDLAVATEQTAIRLLAEYKPGRRLYTNVEFYAAAVMRAVQMPAELFTPTFTAARMVGWTAHVLEQSGNNRIFRPQSLYTGSMPVER